MATSCGLIPEENLNKSVEPLIGNRHSTGFRGVYAMNFINLNKLHKTMRKLYCTVLQRMENFGRHVKPRVISISRNIDLHENEGRIESSKEKCHRKTLSEHIKNGFDFFSPLHPCRNPYGLVGETLDLQNARNPIVQVGFYRGLETASKTEKEDNVENAFAAASTVEELEIAFRALESVFDGDDKRLGMACLRMGQEFESAGEDPQTILAYTKRAVRILEKDNKDSIMLVMSLHLMGSLHYALGKFHESLCYLNRANGILEKEGSQFQTKPIAYSVQVLLGDVKTALGRRKEALSNYVRSLELMEEVLEPEHPQLAVLSKKVAEAFVAVMNFREALALCLKALDIHRKHLGENSMEVAMDRRLLAAIYGGQGEHDKALEENEVAKRVLKISGMKKELFYVELDSANIQISQGRYDDAINMLKGIFQQTDKDSELRAMVLLYMGKALCNLKNYADSKKCCELATKTFKKHEQISPEKVGEAYIELAMMYETMDDFGSAISLYKMALGIFEKSPKDQHAEGSTAGRIGWLLLMTGSVKEGISYLESAAEKLKESLGPHHFGVGYIYNNLGLAYDELERPSAAARMFAMAKGVMEIALGPQHMDTIETIQSLANMHGFMGSYELAIGFQRQVIEALENHGPSGMNELREAHRHLADLERQARQPAGRSLLNAIPHHSISGKLLTKINVSEIEIKDTDNISGKPSTKKNVSKIETEDTDIADTKC